MSNSYEENLQSFSKELQQQYSDIEPKVQAALGNMEKTCLENSKNNCDRFVECMLDSSKRIEKEFKKFELKLAFQQHLTQQCFQKAYQSKQSYNQCKQEAKDRVNQYIDNFLFQLKK
eukprot:TRINITY_DN5476_c0_g1_i2.p3 TRINITY_DN5476_c0_g1~~TRINITY_DN5476_c0_g1_i2.p3  ORF type:complete len:117 (-),score=23.77 TRINITY_DN5476_c0_g1_i2:121-471(-)